MGEIGEEELMKWDKMQGAGSAREEKILVLVRLRPLSDKEIARNEVSDWECINETSILFRNSLQERSMFPTAYTYGKDVIDVFPHFLRISCIFLFWLNTGIEGFSLGLAWFLSSSPECYVYLTTLNFFLRFVFQIFIYILLPELCI